MTCNGIRGLFVAVLMALAPVALLQASIDRGIIQGTVTDQQGAVVPGATASVESVPAESMTMPVPGTVPVPP